MSSKPQEKELYSFGPMGVGLCFSRPGFIKWIVQNSTKIVLTDRRIYGVPNGIGLIPTRLLLFKDKASFQVPYSTIVSTESFNYLLWKVLWIQYREGEKTKEVSVMCNPANYQHLVQAEDILQRERGPPPPASTCPTCGASLRYIQQYQRWYCDREQKYV